MRDQKHAPLAATTVPHTVIQEEHGAPKLTVKRQKSSASIVLGRKLDDSSPNLKDVRMIPLEKLAQRKSSAASSSTGVDPPRSRNRGPRTEELSMIHYVNQVCVEVGVIGEELDKHNDVCTFVSERWTY